jgi:sigma-54 dependent transcriptional regulator, acetoin dehydrogenase operon transcriptional activator AcoR
MLSLQILKMKQTVHEKETSMLTTLSRVAEQRLRNIDQARRAVLHDGCAQADGLSEPWIARSWQRCLASGQRPDQTVVFDVVSAQALRRSEEANHVLLAAARPALKKLNHAITDTRYFAILTNADGVVVDVSGPVDRRDARASAIARIGLDLSERAVGTTAISAALTELQPIWLHRGEHFFNGNAAYSCAGAPLFGPDGQCVGMLDLTGIEVDERPELKHLVAQSARSIENALTVARAHSLLVRLNWPGRTLGDESDGLVCLDADGWVTGANQTARQMVSHLSTANQSAYRDTHQGAAAPVHSSELFAMPFEMLFDSAGRDAYGEPAPMDVPLWSGLRLNAISQTKVQRSSNATPSQWGGLGGDNHSLRDVEIALIRKAVSQAKGNVMQAARELGISRATVYRKLGHKKTES